MLEYIFKNDWWIKIEIGKKDKTDTQTQPQQQVETQS